MKFPYNPILTIQSNYKAGRLSREEAKEELAFVLDIEDDGCSGARPSSHKSDIYNYGPLVRLSDVCNILHRWAGAASSPLSNASPVKQKQRAAFYDAWSLVSIAITKSNLLARLFFSEEELRLSECPEHKGRWSGCVWDKEIPCGCGWNGNITGWLENK